MACASKVLMIRPAAFGYNPQTAASNSFQNQQRRNDIFNIALGEFNKAVDVLLDNHIDVWLQDDTPTPHKPDAVFPNNWIGFHPGKQVVLYPMMAENRRLERRTDIFTTLALEHNYKPVSITDLSYLEKQGIYLEGTGSVVFDHPNKIAYCCLSPRSNRKALAMLCQTINYTAVAFTATDANNLPIYHTNVVMSVLQNHVIICLEAIPSDVEQQMVIDSIAQTNKKPLLISYEQMLNFCGNVLEVATTNGEPRLIMSATARRAFSDSQLNQLNYTKPLVIDIPVIEYYGGGSARCMLAEVFD